MRTLWIIGLIVAIMTVETLHAEEPAEWKEILGQWHSYDWFIQNCEAGTLPEISRGFLSRKVPNNHKPIVQLARTGWLTPFTEPATKRYQMAGWTNAYKQFIPDELYLGYESFRQLGVYCFRVEGANAQVRLTCRDYWAPCPGTVQTFELSEGFEAMLVHHGSGISTGRYVIETQCDGCEEISLTITQS